VAEQQSALRPRPWLTIEQAAEHAQCGVSTLRREVRAGHLRAFRLAGRKALRFRTSDVDLWVEAGEVVPVGGRRG
jgi:excisionase family DNA binding protein